MTVDELRYINERQINQIVPANFTISLKLGDYTPTTSLQWSCTQWGEWTPSNDGTCRYVKRPLYNGTMTRGQLQYKLNQTCSKYLFRCVCTNVNCQLLIPKLSDQISVQLNVHSDISQERL